MNTQKDTVNMPALRAKTDAVNAVIKGMSVTKAAKRYKVGLSTLYAAVAERRKLLRSPIAQRAHLMSTEGTPEHASHAEGIKTTADADAAIKRTLGKLDVLYRLRASLAVLEHFKVSKKGDA